MVWSEIPARAAPASAGYRVPKSAAPACASQIGRAGGGGKSRESPQQIRGVEWFGQKFQPAQRRHRPDTGSRNQQHRHAQVRSAELAAEENRERAPNKSAALNGLVRNSSPRSAGIGRIQVPEISSTGMRKSDRQSWRRRKTAREPPTNPRR